MLIALLCAYAVLIVVMTCFIADVMTRDVVVKRTIFKKATMVAMYHGSYADFTSIDVKKLKHFAYGKGLYMSSSKDIALSYGSKLYVFYVPLEALKTVYPANSSGSYSILPLELVEFIEVKRIA